MSEFERFLVAMVVTYVVLIFALVGLAINIAKRKKEVKKMLSELTQKIDKTCKVVFGVEGKPTDQVLNALWRFAEKTVGGELERFVTQHGISSVCDTASNLGCCGVSQTHFFMNLDETDSEKYDTLMNAGNLNKYYSQIHSYIKNSKRGKNYYPEARKLITYIDHMLPIYVQLKKSGCNSLAEYIPLDDIVYFKVDGSVQYLSNVHGGGVNLQGAAVGAILGGGAAAIIGSQVGTETRTQFVKQDDRKIIIFYEEDGEGSTIVVESTDFDSTINAFRQLIPQKEESAAQVMTHKQQQPVTALSSADELKKFKELLDCGVISQEEFNAKKKQLLGL